MSIATGAGFIQHRRQQFTRCKKHSTHHVFKANMKNIALAFIKAKRAFGPVLKTSTNPHFKSKFAALDACLEAVDDACLANGIALYQETFENDRGVTIETVFLHETGETLRCGKLSVPAAKNDPQGFGSALTYARRYSLLTACGIAAEDDDGNAAGKKKGSAIPASFKSSPTMGALDEVNPEDLVYLQELAMEIIGALREGEPIDAWKRLEKEKLDSDQKTALWSLLDSTTRSAIKAAKPVKEEA
jgi:hypothetical protein